MAKIIYPLVVQAATALQSFRFLLQFFFLPLLLCCILMKCRQPVFIPKKKSQNKFYDFIFFTDDDAENIFLRYLEQTKLPQKQNTDDRLKTLLLRTLIGKVNAHQSEEELDKPKTRF